MLIDFLIRHNVIDEQERDIYYYGLFVMKINIITDIVVIAISILMNRLYFGILYLFLFGLIRVLWGGYHSSTPITCFFSFIFIFMMNLGVYIYCVIPFINEFITIFLLFIYYVPSFLTRNESVYLKNEKKKKQICIIFFLFSLLKIQKINEIMFLSLLTNIILHLLKMFKDLD